jgi:hypothetical protein
MQFLAALKALLCVVLASALAAPSRTPPARSHFAPDHD